MRTILSGVSALALASLLLAGCQSDRITGISTAPISAAPQNLGAAPAGSVSAAPLPAPSSPQSVLPPVNGAAQFPDAPTSPTVAAPAGTQVASASGPDVTVGSVAGVWTVSLAGQSCKVATPQTKFGQGFRAGPLKCPAEMANVKSWNVAGKQLVMYDESGATIARLYSTGTGFSGQTAGGAPISFNR